MSQDFKMPKPVDYVPERVVSLVPSITKSLFDMQLDYVLIGITNYCVQPPEALETLPSVGGTKNPDIEKIKSLSPDLVIVNDEENRKEDAETLQAAGIPVWATGPRTVMEAINLLWEIMEVFQDAEMVPRVRLIEQTMDYVSLAMENERPIKTFVPIWKDPWMTANRDTYMHDVMQLFGMENVFADRDRQFPLEADIGAGDPLPAGDSRVAGRDLRYPRISLEEIEATQPELILLPDEPYAFTEADAETFYKLDIPAARLGNIYTISGALLMWHGTHIAYSFTQIPPILAEVRQLLQEVDSNE
jgi:ABC-type Fe3+-hydroxamate transport system substrate-binding protein